MTKRVPPIENRFKPGQSGNPSGRPKGVLCKADVEVLFQKFAKKTKDELQAVVQDPKSTMIEIMVAAVMVKAAKDGDAHRLQFFLDRAVGKVADKLRVEETDDVEKVEVTKENIAELYEIARKA